VSIKWKNPKNGGCLYFDRNGYRYYIIDKLYSDGSISRYWHIECKKIIEPHRRKCKSFWELHFAMFNKNPSLIEGQDKESTAYWSIRASTDYVNCGNDNIRVYVQNGRHFAVDLQAKEFWEYSVAEAVSPDMEYDECKQYAEKYLFKEDTLF
jgi:hypothetical protein